MKKDKEYTNWHRNNIDITKVLAFLRREIQQTSVRVVSRKLDVYETTLRRIVDGERAPSKRILDALCRAYGKHPTEFQLYSKTFVMSLLLTYAQQNNGQLPVISKLPPTLRYLADMFPYQECLDDLSLSCTKEAKKYTSSLKYTDAELLQKMRDFYYLHGRSPYVGEIEPGTMTIVKRFQNRKLTEDQIKMVYPNSPDIPIVGGWNKALILAGLPVNRIIHRQKIS